MRWSCTEIQDIWLNEAMYKLEEADSQKARLAQEVEALKQEARKNQDTALDAFEKLSERQQALDRLQKVCCLVRVVSQCAHYFY